MQEKTIDDAIQVLTGTLLNAGIPSDVVADKLLAMGTGLWAANNGAEAAATRLELAAGTLRSFNASVAQPN